MKKSIRPACACAPLCSCLPSRASWGPERHGDRDYLLEPLLREDAALRERRRRRRASGDTDEIPTDDLPDPGGGDPSDPLPDAPPPFALRSAAATNRALGYITAGAKAAALGGVGIPPVHSDSQSRTGL
jgi:hypothetical protein